MWWDICVPWKGWRKKGRAWLKAFGWDVGWGRGALAGHLPGDWTIWINRTFGSWDSAALALAEETSPGEQVLVTVESELGQEVDVFAGKGDPAVTAEFARSLGWSVVDASTSFV